MTNISLNVEEIHHMVDLIQTRMTRLLMNKSEFHFMDDKQKEKAIMFDKALLVKLMCLVELKGELNEKYSKC